MTRSIDEDIHFRILHYLDRQPASSQRKIARVTGISLGAANFCLRELVKKGQIKAKNFQSSDNKIRYAYVLTPKGIAQKSTLAKSFLLHKIAEYERLKTEIETLRGEFSELE